MIFKSATRPAPIPVTCGVYLGIYNYILTGTGNLVVGGPGTGPAGAVMAFNPAFVGGTNAGLFGRQWRRWTHR